jgi:hypothetical protein
MLTKAVSNKNFHSSLDKLGIKDISTPTWGGVLAWAVQTERQ